MSNNLNIFLPGSINQFTQLKKYTSFEDKTVLFIGAGLEDLAKIAADENAKNVIIIVNDEDVLLNTRLKLAKEKNISVRFMEYDNTDFINKTFDIIYAQASVSTKKRNKILKEILKLSNTETIISIGEIATLTEEIPQFVVDIFERSSISPLYFENITNHYEEKNFKVFESRNYSATLRNFYEKALVLLNKKSPDLNENEKAYYKKLLKKISHESNAYLKLGGDKHIGYISLILKSK